MSSSPPPQVKPILKNANTADNSRTGRYRAAARYLSLFLTGPQLRINLPFISLTWDEDTIALHDQERGTRMKIDEPKTPYLHYEASSDALDSTVPYLELDAAIRNASPQGSGASPAGSRSSSSSRSGDTGSQHHVHVVPSSLEHEWDDGEDDDIPAEVRERKRRFAQMRAQHYNMKEVLAQSRWDRDHSEHTGDSRGRSGNNGAGRLTDGDRARVNGGGHSPDHGDGQVDDNGQTSNDSDLESDNKSSASDHGDPDNPSPSSRRQIVRGDDDDDHQDDADELGDRRGNSPNGRKRWKGV
ncbi:hypothetical protein RI367_001427 [Sorochytrium milnesiophthora]